MLLKYESSSPYIHNKPNSTITAKFIFKEQGIIINAKADSHKYGGGYDFYIEAESPVPTDISSTISFTSYMYEYDDITGEENLQNWFESNETLTINAGDTKSNVIQISSGSTGGYYSWEYTIDEKKHPWNNTTSGNYRFVLGTDDWK